MPNVPELQNNCGSWIIIDKRTGKGVLELFKDQRAVVEQVDIEKYEIMTSYDYLVLLNQKKKYYEH